MNRHTDAIAIRVLIFLFASLLIFSVVVYAAQQYAQPAVMPVAVDAVYGSLERRIDALEKLRIDARLSVLEDVDKRTGEIRLLGWGTVFTLLGNIALTAWQIRSQRGRRGQ